MNAPDSLDQEIEQDRQQRISELVADSGTNWGDDYRPGSIACHELLDRTAMLAEMLENFILNHPACIANAGWYELASQASTLLGELYQRVGAEHLSAENRNPE